MLPYIFIVYIILYYILANKKYKNIQVNYKKLILLKIYIECNKLCIQQFLLKRIKINSQTCNIFSISKYFSH